MNKTLNKSIAITILTIVTLSIIPATLVMLVQPLSAQVVLAITSSREPFGNKFWKNQTFYVDIWLSSKPADEITATVTVKGIPYAVNAAYLTGTAYKFRLWFNITANGVVYANKSNPDGTIPTFTTDLGTLSDGDTITVAYADKSLTLTFTHTKASLSIRKDVPYPINATNTSDFYIIAPDLNYNSTGIDTVLVEIYVVDYTKNINRSATILFNETEANSGKFVNKTVDIYNVTLGVDGYNVVPGDYVEVVVKVPQYSGAVDVDTVVETINVFSTTPEISILRADLGRLEVLIKDPDENKNSTAKDTIRLYIKFCNGSEILQTVDETDKNTGEFKFSSGVGLWLDANNILSGVNASCNTIYLNVTTGYYNPVTAGYEEGNVTRKVTVSYYTAELDVTPAEVIIGAASSIQLTIKDKDLNIDPSVRDIWNITLGAGELLEDKVLNHSVLGDLDGLANLTITAVRGDKSWPLNASSTYTIVFVESGVDTGEFTARIDLGRFNWTNITSMIGGLPEKLVITYKDIYTPDLKTVTKEKEVLAAKPSISVDRDYIPLTTYDDIKFVVTVKDPAAAGRGSISVSCAVYAYNGTQIPSACPATDTALETGIATGEFKVKISIDNASVKPYLIGGKVVVSYESLSKEVPFKLCGVKMKVNDTDLVKVFYGEVIEITIEDPDRNLDTEVEDEFQLGVFSFKETGKNTGVFKAKYTVDSGLGSPASTITIKYEDKTPTYATSGMDEWPDPDTYEVKVYIKSMTGELTVNDKVGYVEVGPVGKLSIVVKDLDANRDVNAADSVRIDIKLWNGTFLPPRTASETDKSTGIFKLDFDLSNLGSIGDYIGKEFVIYYRDSYDVNGKPATLSTTVKVLSWDGKIETDKKAYNVGERIRITVKDPDANENLDVVETRPVRVYSTSDPIGTSINLVETGKNTGVFVGEVLLSEVPGPGRVYVKFGDTVTIEYIDDFPADYAVTGKSKIFTESVTVGIPVERPIEVKKASFIDPRTGAAVVPKVGSMVGISVELSNVGVTDQVFTAILVVKDPEGVVVSVQSVSIPLAAGKSGTVAFSFTPKVVGDFGIEVYIVRSLADWSPLGEMLAATMTVAS